MSTFESVKQAECLDKLVLNFYKSDLKFVLSPQEVHLLTWNTQNNFLELTVNSRRLKNYPGNREFTRLFFKKLIDRLQDAQEIHDGFYTSLCASVLKNKDSESNFYYRHYVIGNDLDNIITLKETSNMVANGTTGLRTWEAARMLADWALCNKEVFANKKVLELGSGVGFTGITIAKLCDPSFIILTDCHPDVLRTIAKNVDINFPECDYEDSFEYGTIFTNGNNKIGVLHLNWNDYQEFTDSFVPDIIIGADIVYDPSIMEPLCKVFKHFFSMNRYLEIYIQSVVRNPKTFEKFYYKLGGMNFEVQKIQQKQSTFVDWDPKTEKSLLKITLSDT